MGLRNVLMTNVTSHDFLIGPDGTCVTQLSSINFARPCTGEPLKKPFPGCVKLSDLVAFCLPTAGRKTQLFHLIFTQPGTHLLEHPCTVVA